MHLRTPPVVCMALQGSLCSWVARFSCGDSASKNKFDLERSCSHVENAAFKKKRRREIRVMERIPDDVFLHIIGSFDLYFSRRRDLCGEDDTSCKVPKFRTFLRHRLVSKTWKTLVETTIFPLLIQCVVNYVDATFMTICDTPSLLRIVSKYFHRPHMRTPKWYDAYPAHNYMFEGGSVRETDSNHSRCCSWTRNGKRCSSRTLNKARLCKQHQKRLNAIGVDYDGTKMTSTLVSFH